MAQQADFNYVEGKAFEYAEAYRAAGYRASVHYMPDGSLVVGTVPPLPTGVAMGLALSESLPDLQGRC